MTRAAFSLIVVGILSGAGIARASVLSELVIDAPSLPLFIADDVILTADYRVDVTADYVQNSGTLRSVVALLHVGTLFGDFSNEGEHLGRGIFVDSITYDANRITVDFLQAAPGDVNGDWQVDAADIQLILAANSFDNGPGFDWTQGDNNGDGLVNASDIQNILAANLFGAGSYISVDESHEISANPEPSSLLVWALLGIIGVLTRRWRR